MDYYLEVYLIPGLRKKFLKYTIVEAIMMKVLGVPTTNLVKMTEDLDGCIQYYIRKIKL
jgi:hypothetical protein